VNLISLGSDNHSGVHPQLMQAMVAVNHGYAPSYEQDDQSQRLKKIFKEQFNAVDSAMVFNGTAANVVALQLALKSYEAVLCAQSSHLNLDECGAPEKIAGVKLIPTPVQEGKIAINKLESLIVRQGDQHHSQVRMISITQPTEYGTLYSFEEIHQLKELAQKHQLYLHMDGARLANAVVAMNTSFKELCQAFDLISFGGAKNGLMLGEFVIVRNPKLKEGLKFYRKQSLQLPAKTRFLSAPFIEYLTSPLWKEIAQHENTLALKLRKGLETIPEIQFTQPTQANSVFCILPRHWIKKLRQKFFFYIWDENCWEVRLMTSFATTADEIDAFIQAVQSIQTGSQEVPL
jgi:threonine aldolase